MLTMRTARKFGKPLLHLNLAEVGAGEVCRQVRTWLDEHDPTVLNVAGGRESKSPGLGEYVRQVMLTVLGGSPSGAQQSRGPDWGYAQSLATNLSVI